jgi:UDP-GlcNAc3NAcA epimerase
LKIVTIIGARPQFIKAAVISREFAQYGDIEEIIVHTGQHYDSNMSDIFFEEMSIAMPKYHLGIGGYSQGSMTGKMIEKLEEVLTTEDPDYILVYGDTNSTLAGAIAATKLHIPIIHIEAGLRSFNMNMPEEVNRILTDRVSSLLFCPTQEAYKNLEAEGLEHWKSKAFVSGDVMQDGAFFYGNKAKPLDLDMRSDDFALCTVHRAENTNSEARLREIFAALTLLSKKCQIVLPLHPRTKAQLADFCIDIPGAVKVIEPVGYLHMIWLIKNCSFVITDSGGLQKEAFFFSKYCITLRDETEWVELVSEGVNILTGASRAKILDTYEQFRAKPPITFDQSLYGGGLASQKIVQTIIKDFETI